LAITAAMLASWLKISVALLEIMIGILAALLIKLLIPDSNIHFNGNWFEMLAAIGALMLTFLAGTELEMGVLKREYKGAAIIGMSSFCIPFLISAAVAYYGFGWSTKASLLTGLVLSTTSVAVIYGTLLEFGINNTNYGKSLLTTCFVTDLCTVLTLGFIFSPFSIKTILFFTVAIIVCLFLPRLCKKSFQLFGDKPYEFELKFILFFLLALGIIARWSGYEAVLPAFLIGIALSGSVGVNKALVKHLRTVTFGLLTPVYFIRAGSLVSVPDLVTVIVPVIIFLCVKVTAKSIGVYPLTQLISPYKKEGIYTSLLMSTGLAFGSIVAMFGLASGIIDQQRYSLLVAVVVSSAIIPTIIANMFYLPKHLLNSSDK
jgi:Kef-type K+ transport system membrane component KefB